MAHITIYKGTSQPYRKFRSTNGVEKFLKKVFHENYTGLKYVETLHNFFNIYLSDYSKTLYSLQIVE